MTETKRESDRHEKFVAEALLLRALHAYREARERAKEDGVDLSLAPELTSSYASLSDRYDDLMQGWAGEHPETAAGAVAVLELAGLIVAQLHRRPFVEESTIVYEERDLAYALQLISGVQGWANERNIEDCAGRIRRERRAQS